MASLKRKLHVVPDSVSAEDTDFLFGGQNDQFGCPPLDPASNFTRFLPPNAVDTPETLFMPSLNKCAFPAPRFTRRSNKSEFLIYTDGACSENGNKDARGGCAFVFRPETSISFIQSQTSSDHPTSDFNLHKLGSCYFRLEARGPTGEARLQTSNRAELRAVIAALRFRAWKHEGCKRIVIATDSSYVVNGSTEWLKKWARNGWQTSTRNPVKNQDLWKALIKDREKWSRAGVEVQFWHIPRKLNTIADRLAKSATALTDREDWAEIQGITC
ncbi:RNase H domain protein [Paraphoma chrysanthemicola]|uniref:ribonuclease H n=1 Tax=Paraphoma chrysanthemicola TaxID=798071 RepID=A0A8K0R3N9_9PLEO|nr:RNase H domain protein [Paraphoma chrysanthemicola]